MKYFIDTEFIETPGHIELLSIGIICEDGREYYAVHTEANLKDADTWVKENVLEKMPEYNKSYNDLRAGGDEPEKYGKKDMETIKKELLYWCGQKNNVPEKCEFYGYYSDYDWVVFCWIFGRMIDLPKGFPMFCIDLKQMLHERNLHKDWVEKNVPKQENEHHALNDAKWNKSLYESLSEYDLNIIRSGIRQVI